MATYHALGLMSGSSLDGLDIVHCRFEENDEKWHYEILNATTVPYPTKWKLRLKKLVLQNAITYLKTHVFFGHYIGGLVKDFIDERGIHDQIDFIVSHGQTVFHQPENRLTSQIGDGAAIATATGFPVIAELRSADVALGGQGTPLVPIGEKYLFPDHDLFLNMGGIANITAKLPDRIIAFDVCPVNLPLNQVAQFSNIEYDKNGEMARSGQLNEDLLGELNKSWYYDKEYPKSLSGGWVSKVMMPVLKRFRIPVEDKLRTLTEHIALQIANGLEMVQRKEGIELDKSKELLLSGGGAYNQFLVERLHELAPVTPKLANDDVVQFKEAIITGFAGVKRMRKESNMLASVTGAERDNIGGCIYQAM